MTSFTIADSDLEGIKDEVVIVTGRHIFPFYLQLTQNVVDKRQAHLLASVSQQSSVSSPMAQRYTPAT